MLDDLLWPMSSSSSSSLTLRLILSGFCRTPRLETQKETTVSDANWALIGSRLSTIVGELKAHDYCEDVIPDFQRIAISGEETSGVSKEHSVV